MAAWKDLLEEFESHDPPDRSPWMVARLQQALQEISQIREGRNVIFYASSFLQKPEVSAVYTQLTYEEVNGLMSVLHGMDCKRGLTLVLHTPGGMTNAAESVVSYLRSKFDFIEAVVPTYAMSAGTMIALATNRIVMGRQSQLGPIDPQMPFQGRAISARAIVDQFEQAKTEVSGDLKQAHVWAPVLQSVGPALLQEAQNALEYGERMVARWLASGMLANDFEKAVEVAAHFNDASVHKSHGRRIDRDEATKQGLVVEELEANQDFQDAVLTAYHLVTLAFEQGPASKAFFADHGRHWVKNLTPR